ncbi:TolB family protein [Caloranaerobacter sp. DY30410]|uniref:TolB family protein n=1 Tax=Caloranaerobacter sp. DY30410 TaxID=3238305 RepID=UPI003D050326
MKDFCKLHKKLYRLICVLILVFLFMAGCAKENQVINKKNEPNEQDTSIAIKNNTKDEILEVLNSTRENIEAKLKEREDVYAVTWSYDGQQVAFVRGDTEGWYGQMYIWTVGKKKPVSIGEEEDRICEFIWSPNSKYVFVDTGTSCERWGFIVSTDNFKIIDGITYTGVPLWSYDSKWIALGTISDIQPPAALTELSGTVDLTIYNVETREKRIIAKGTSDFKYTPRQWNKDGILTYEKIYFNDPEKSEQLTYHYKSK